MVTIPSLGRDEVWSDQTAKGIKGSQALVRNPKLVAQTEGLKKCLALDLTRLQWASKDWSLSRSNWLRALPKRLHLLPIGRVDKGNRGKDNFHPFIHIKWYFLEKSAYYHQLQNEHQACMWSDVMVLLDASDQKIILQTTHQRSSDHPIRMSVCKKKNLRGQAISSRRRVAFDI